METRSKPGVRNELLLLAFALSAWAVATAHLMVLLWRFVPTQAAVFAGMGATPTPGFRLAVGASTFMVRWLPWMVLAAQIVIPVVAAAAGLAAWRFGVSRRTMLRACVVIALAGASYAVLASFGIVHSAQSVRDGVKVHPRFERR
jgi:hypothetical protein